MHIMYVTVKNIISRKKETLINLTGHNIDILGRYPSMVIDIKICVHLKGKNK